MIDYAQIREQEAWGDAAAWNTEYLDGEVGPHIDGVVQELARLGGVLPTLGAVRRLRQHEGIGLHWAERIMALTRWPATARFDTHVHDAPPWHRAFVTEPICLLGVDAYCRPTLRRIDRDPDRCPPRLLPHAPFLVFGFDSAREIALPYNDLVGQTYSSVVMFDGIEPTDDIVSTECLLLEFLRGLQRID
jgi:hypothetical protein